MFLLIKEKDGEISTHSLISEDEVREHLTAMWKFTEWRLIAVVKI